MAETGGESKTPAENTQTITRNDLEGLIRIVEDVLEKLNTKKTAMDNSENKDSIEFTTKEVEDIITMINVTEETRLERNEHSAEEHKKSTLEGQPEGDAEHAGDAELQTQQVDQNAVTAQRQGQETNTDGNENQNQNDENDDENDDENKTGIGAGTGGKKKKLKLKKRKKSNSRKRKNKKGTKKKY